MRARAIVFMAIALAAGLGSAWMVTRYVSGRAAAGAPIPMSKVVVAAQDIPFATSLTPEMLKVVDWPTSVKPQGSFEGPIGLDGRVASSTLVAGEPIIEARLAPLGAGSGMASLITANMRAMTVPVNDVVGVAGFIHPRDFVDVITTMQGPVAPGAEPGKQDDFRSKIVLQDILVLAVGQQLPSDTGSVKTEAVTTVTLLVSPEESERLALASTAGKLQLTMRSQRDRDQVETPGVSPPELLGLVRLAPAPAPAAPVARAYVAPTPRAAAPPATPPIEVVEVLHGDRVEQRKFTPKAVR